MFSVVFRGKLPLSAELYQEAQMPWYQPQGIQGIGSGAAPLQWKGEGEGRGDTKTLVIYPHHRIWQFKCRITGPLLVINMKRNLQSVSMPQPYNAKSKTFKSAFHNIAFCLISNLRNEEILQRQMQQHLQILFFGGSASLS